MFFKIDSPSIRLTGRWSKDDNVATTTATGAYIELAFCGECAFVHFDIKTNTHPYPHLWVSVDGGAEVETALDEYIRICCNNNGNHIVKIIFKSTIENRHRWYSPLISKVSFLGFEADKQGVLPEDKRKTIEFIGDSITEGTLTDDGCAKRSLYTDPDLKRVYENDQCATYAALTAKELNLRPLIMGYGSVGLTKGGCGGVPSAIEAYGYYFDGSPTNYPDPDYIVINHGANDRNNTAENYINAYREFLDMIRKKRKNSKIFVLSAFCGVFNDELEKFIAEYGNNITFISSKGWVPVEPLHPGRQGHADIAHKLSEKLKEVID